MKRLLPGAAGNTFMDRHIKEVRNKKILKYVLKKWDVN